MAKKPAPVKPQINASLANALQLFSGNLMYIKDGPTKNANEYVTVAVRYQNNEQIALTKPDGESRDSVPTQLYLPLGTIDRLDLKVGDMISFAATRLVEGDMLLADGDVLHKARGFQPGSVQVALKARKAAETHVTGEASEGLQKQFASIAGTLSAFFGLK